MDKHATQLEQHLRDLLAQHDAMLRLITHKREALRLAKPALVEQITAKENAHVQRIGDIEQQRQRVVAALTQSITPQAQQPLRLGQIADALGEPVRGRLLVLQQQLHDRMNQVRREGAITRRAMEGLLNHVQGIVQSIVQNVGGGGTYGRRGQVETATAVVGSFSATA